MESNENATFESWLKANLEPSQIKDLASHGADAGWPGLTYYSETGELYEIYKDEIWKALSDDADEYGCQSVFEMIAGFGCARSVNCVETFENLMVWYMAERTARNLDCSDD